MHQKGCPESLIVKNYLSNRWLDCCLVKSVVLLHCLWDVQVFLYNTQEAQCKKPSGQKSFS